MKKFLATLLCTLPFATSAVTIGGFEFPKADVIENPAAGIRLVKWRTEDGTPWVGTFSDGRFALAAKAAGRNKAWMMISAEKGSDLGQENHQTVRSIEFLQAVDCAESRYRILKITSYTGYFLDGSPIGLSDNTVSDWMYETSSHPCILLGCIAVKLDTKGR